MSPPAVIHFLPSSSIVNLDAPPSTQFSQDLNNSVNNYQEVVNHDSLSVETPVLKIQTDVDQQIYPRVNWRRGML